jgi:hypothetical protein
MLQAENDNRCGMEQPFPEPHQSHSEFGQSEPPALSLLSAPRFYAATYPAEHWAMIPCLLNDPKMIALARFEELQFAIFINPTDSRGYRCIVRLIDNENMPSTFNRDYSAKEHLGLALITEQAERAMRLIVPLPQVFKLGNNAHGFEASSETVLVGNEHEPCILHSHVLGRGNPEGEYIAGIKLGGPPPGVIFDIGGKGLASEGQQSTPWQRGDIARAASALKNAISKFALSLPDKVAIEL